MRSWSRPASAVVPLRWRRRDAAGVLAGTLDALGGTMRALQGRIDGLELKDPLTGVLNHRGLHDALHEALEGAGSRAEKVAVVVLDIDNFEQLNAAGGHAAGDEVLRMAARVILGELRPGDVCGRIGGDEFLLALPDSDAWGAERVVDRLRSAVASVPIREGRSGLSFSAGIAEFPRDARDQAGLMRLADGALYRAKRSGRNRCVVYSSFVDAPLSLQEEAEQARSAGLANTVYALALAVDLKDGYTHQHSARVAQYAAVLARELGHVGGGDRADPDGRHPARRRQGRRRRCRAAQAGAADRGRVPRDAAPFQPGARHRPGRGHAGDRRMGALPARELGRQRLSRQARGRRDPACEPRARRRRRVRGDDLVAPLPSRHAGREGADGARELGRRQFDPDVAQRMVDLVRSGAIPLGEIGVLDVTHYGSAAGSGGAKPPDEEGEPVRNVAPPSAGTRAAPAPRFQRSGVRAGVATTQRARRLRPTLVAKALGRPHRSAERGPLPRTAGLQRRNSSTSRS